jgi:Transposase DDE domain group 1
VKAHDTQRLVERKSRIEERLDGDRQWESAHPVVEGRNLHYEVAGRVSATALGGIGLIHEFVRSIGLAESLDRNVQMLKRHFPYHESDHVLNMAYNLLTGGTCIEDIERLRQDESYLEAVGAERVPDPTTAGDFLRRFDRDSLCGLMQGMDEVRPALWSRLPKTARSVAIIDVDGTLAPTEGECKEGMGISYKGDWGYHPLLVTLANTGEVLSVTNRPGNETSHQDAAWHLDEAIDQVLSGGFDRARLRGDTAFSLTENFDRWEEEGVEFVFGFQAHEGLVAEADFLPERGWQPLRRRTKHKRKGPARARPENVKERIVKENGYTNYELEEEHITEFSYRPGACKKPYRMIALRKRIRVTKGQLRLNDEIRYFFYVTNAPKERLRAERVVFEANDRCNQENVIEQMKNGVHAMRAPSDTLDSNWAWMLIGALAWNIKQWMGVSLPRRMKSEGKEICRMEFRRFLQSLIALPCQLVHTARRTVLRILTYSPWAQVLIDGTEYFRTLRRRA